jgi:hypothetical protein
VGTLGRCLEIYGSEGGGFESSRARKNPLVTSLTGVNPPKRPTHLLDPQTHKTASLPPNGRTVDQLPVLCASVSNSAARIKQSAATAAGVGSPSQVKEISRIASSSISTTRTR